jgi:hypothetical protein
LNIKTSALFKEILTMKFRTDLTAERVRELLDYNPETGIFRWRATGPGRRLDGVAGRIDGNGYLGIGIDRERFYAHRLVFLYVCGRWPNGDVDHINGQRADNRLENLREATRGQNCLNAKLRHDNTTGFRGVYRTHSGKYQARFGRKILGRFATAEEASAAHRAAAIQAHGHQFFRAA